MESIICIYCGKKKIRPKRGEKGHVSLKRWKEMKFCSHKCSNCWNTEHKKTGFYKGHPTYKINCWWKGKKMSLEYKKKISDGLKNNPKVLKHIGDLAKKYSGKNHWNWQGGITDKGRKLRHSKQYNKWRFAVYRRDKYTCQECGIKCTKYTIVAHHIKSFKNYPKLRYVISNGQTCCRKCHKKIHKDIGAKTRFTYKFASANA